MKKAKKKFDIYEKINSIILDNIDNHEIPWRKAWNSYTIPPKNLISKKYYSGINVLLLSLATAKKNYKSPYWLTFNQCKDLQGSVKKGERSTLIVFWTKFTKEIENQNEELEDKEFPCLRYYLIFNTEQCTLPEKITDKINNEIAEKKKNKKTTKNYKKKICEDLIKNYKIEIRNNESMAFYSPKFDYISLPTIKQFNNSFEYYSTLYHEIIHSTGHKKRLNRSGIVDIQKFGSHDYSKEELIAEIGSSYFCAMAGISNKVIENQLSYLKNWLIVLNNNKKWLVQAFGQASKAIDFICNIDNNLKD